jgi:hypothetical protein
MLSLQGVEVSVVDLERSLTEQLLDPIDKDLWKAGELSGVAEWAAHDGVVPLRPGPLSISVDLIGGWVLPMCLRSTQRWRDGSNAVQRH